MLSRAILGAFLAAIVGSHAQEGNDTAPVSLTKTQTRELVISNVEQFPNTTYPDALSPNPAAVAGAQSNQASPPKYPSPWSTGAGDWEAAWQRATEVVAQLTLDEKVNLTTGLPFPSLPPSLPPSIHERRV